MTVMGGLERFTGPVVGAFAVVALEKYLDGFGGWVTVRMLRQLKDHRLCHHVHHRRFLNRPAH
jgi:ABC-type branched-subunit amino acid transport system permease subunit